MEICPRCKKATAERNHNDGKLACYNRDCMYIEGETLWSATTIEICFPFKVDLPKWLMQGLHRLMSKMGDYLSDDEHDVWASSQGYKITRFPVMAGDEKIEFDEDVYHIGFSVKDKR